jgi:membrane fusion protein (multidrug efflux system)
LLAPPEDGRETGLRNDQSIVEMILADGSLHPYKGRLVFADRPVDASTGTLLIEIAYPNPDKLLRPGQFGRARVVIDTKSGALLVPQKAVSTLQSVDSVAVVKPDKTVETRRSRPASASAPCG